MIKYFRPFITLLFLSQSTLAFAISLDKEGKAQLHGYIQRIAQSKVQNPKLIQRNRLEGDDTEAGLNLNWQFRPTTRLITDLNYHSKSPDNQQLNLNILSLNQTLYSADWGTLSLGAGRLKNTLIGFNSAQDAPLLRETTDYARIYMGNMAQTFSSIDGVRLQSEWSDEKGNLVKGLFFIGKMLKNTYQNIKISSNMHLNVKDYSLQGGKLYWEPAALPGLLFGGTFVNVDTRHQITLQQGQQNIHLSIANNIQLHLLMARYQWQNWQLSGEWVNTHIGKSTTGNLHNFTQPSWYLSLIWQPNSHWMTTLRYESSKYGQLTQNLVHSMPQNQNGGNNTQSNQAPVTMTGWIGYVRYQFQPHYFAGIELDWLHDTQHDDTITLAQIGASF